MASKASEETFPGIDEAILGIFIGGKVDDVINGMVACPGPAGETQESVAVHGSGAVDVGGRVDERDFFWGDRLAPTGEEGTGLFGLESRIYGQFLLQP